MHKIKIKLSSPEIVSDFIKVCSKYECDINLYDGRNVIDAKSIIGVFTIAQGKVIEVQVITEEEDTIIKFIDDMKQFGVYE